jgi:hypothetical protein
MPSEKGIPDLPSGGKEISEVWPWFAKQRRIRKKKTVGRTKDWKNKCSLPST